MRTGGAFDVDRRQRVNGITLGSKGGEDFAWIFALEQRAAFAPRYALDQHVDVGVKPDRDGMFQYQRTGFSIHECAAARRNNLPRLFQQTPDDAALAIAKGRLAIAFKYIGDGHICRFFNFLIGIDKRQFEPQAEPATDRRFANAHHTDQHDGTIVGRGCGFDVSLHVAGGYTASRVRSKSVIALDSMLLLTRTHRMKADMKIKRHSSVFDTPLGSSSRRRMRLPLVPIAAVVLLVLGVAFLWSRGGEQSQVNVQKVIPAEKLGQ